MMGWKRHRDLQERTRNIRGGEGEGHSIVQESVQFITRPLFTLNASLTRRCCLKDHFGFCSLVAFSVTFEPLIIKSQRKRVMGMGNDSIILESVIEGDEGLNHPGTGDWRVWIIQSYWNQTLE